MRNLAIALSGALLVRLFGPRWVPRKSKAAPLGSLMNPVRAKGPEGRARYRSRLRYPTGSVLEIRPVSCVGQGVYDNFVELYEVSWGEAIVQVYMGKGDAGPVDVDPIPGFTLLED